MRCELLSKQVCHICFIVFFPQEKCTNVEVRTPVKTIVYIDARHSCLLMKYSVNSSRVLGDEHFANRSHSSWWQQGFSLWEQDLPLALYPLWFENSFWKILADVQPIGKVFCVIQPKESPPFRQNIQYKILCPIMEVFNYSRGSLKGPKPTTATEIVLSYSTRPLAGESRFNIAVAELGGAL
jgi:hypothetical protein